MIVHWLIYLLSLVACTVFSVVYQGWLGWILLLFVLTIPLLSLLVSLPAMLSVRLGVHCAGLLTAGDREFPQLTTRCPLPAPPIRGQLRITNTLTGQSLRLKPGNPLPADHCGQLLCAPERAVAFDYLGLFCIGISRKDTHTVLVRPHPLTSPLPGNLESRLCRSWYPKPGGGFSEHHEMRLYRPGDSLNQIHWKLTAKTGKLVIREAMVSRQRTVTLVIALQGDAGQLDRKFGRLLWTGRQLLERSIPFEILALTGEGAQRLSVADEAGLIQAVDILLSRPPLAGNAPQPATGGWQLLMGGEEDDG